MPSDYSQMVPIRSGSGLDEMTFVQSDDREIDWSPEEERKVIRKLDCIVMPLLILVFIGLQLDRGNMCVCPGCRDRSL